MSAELDKSHRQTDDLLNVYKFTPRNFSKARDKKRVLLLQGPVGPFFKKLQKHLAAHDLDVWRVAFHAGDLCYSNIKKRINFSAGSDDWQLWLNEMLSSGQFDTIIYYGSERPAHKVARELAELYGVDAISLEEGYIRPGLITIERSRNNANSPFSGLLPEGDYKFIPQKQEKINVSKSMSLITLHGAIYFTLRGWFATQAQKELFHRSTPILAEAFMWCRNLGRKLVGSKRNYIIIKNLLRNWNKRYYIVPLQVAADTNMKEAALGWNSVGLVASAIKSFAFEAPKNTRLVFKIHPMERGHNAITPIILSTAETYGIAERVDVIDNGSMGLLARNSAGMITINSSSGLSAIFHGAPLLILGKALFANSELATCANGNPDFDKFWTSNHVASKALRKTYIGRLKEKALKPGDFYSGEGMEIACKSIHEKIQSSELINPNQEAFNSIESEKASS